MNVIIVAIFLVFQIKASNVSCNGYKPNGRFQIQICFPMVLFFLNRFSQMSSSFDVHMGEPSQEENDI
jgi:hypothetical protein